MENFDKFLETFMTGDFFLIFLVLMLIILVTLILTFRNKFSFGKLINVLYNSYVTNNL